MANDSQIMRVQQYIDEIDRVAIDASQIRVGRFYTYQYNFDKSGDYNEIKYWDVFPLVFVYMKKGKNFFGLNFHHIPLQSRYIWIARLKKVVEYQYNKDKPLTAFDYQNLYNMFKKATYGVRQYKRMSVRNLKRIETPDQVEELMKIIANTYYGVNYNMVAERYRLFKPQPPKN